MLLDAAAAAAVGSTVAVLIKPSTSDAGLPVADTGSVLVLPAVAGTAVVGQPVSGGLVAQPAGALASRHLWISCSISHQLSKALVILL